MPLSYQGHFSTVVSPAVAGSTTRSSSGSATSGSPRQRLRRWCRLIITIVITSCTRSAVLFDARGRRLHQLHHPVDDDDRLRPRLHPDHGRGCAEDLRPGLSTTVAARLDGQQNLGFTKPSALGDIRYRSVLANNRAILFRRGTIDGLETYVRSVFKSEVTVTNGLNELLLVDDAEFLTGVGDWSPMPWRIGYEVASSLHGANMAGLPVGGFKSRHVKIEAFVEHDDGKPGNPPILSGTGAPWPLPASVRTARGVARIQAFNGEQLAITCGAGQQHVLVGVDSAGQETVYDEQHLDAFYRGIPVDPDGQATYYFSFWSKRATGNTSETDLILFGFMQLTTRAADPRVQRRVPWSGHVDSVGHLGWFRWVPGSVEWNGGTGRSAVCGSGAVGAALCCADRQDGHWVRSVGASRLFVSHHHELPVPRAVHLVLPEHGRCEPCAVADHDSPLHHGPHGQPEPDR